MCLVDAKIKETTEDIVCYKIYLSSEGKLRAPFMRFLAPDMNKVAKTYLEEPYGSENCVDRGFHSFANLEDALKMEENMWEFFNKVVMKCIIPKDSKCYVGTFQGSTSYCSESIILKEIINVKW